MSEMIPALPAPPAKLQQYVIDLQAEVKNLEIRDNRGYLHAGEISKSITRMRKEVEDAFNPIIELAHKAHQKALEQRKRFLMPLEMDQRYVDGLILSWNRVQEDNRRRQEEELAAQKKREQEDQAIREAEQYAREGDQDLAEEVLNQAAAAPVPVVALPPPTPKLEGFAKRTVWRWKIENVDLIPREYLRVDDVRISGVVRALKSATKIPGIKVYPEDIASHRS